MIEEFKQPEESDFIEEEVEVKDFGDVADFESVLNENNKSLPEDQTSTTEPAMVIAAKEEEEGKKTEGSLCVYIHTILTLI